MTWILVIFFWSSAVHSVPGFQTAEECRAAGEAVTPLSRSGGIRFVCVQQSKASK